MFSPTLIVHNLKSKLQNMLLFVPSAEKQEMEGLYNVLTFHQDCALQLQLCV